MSRIKKVAVKEEPRLDIHKYVVQIKVGRRTGYRYCMSLKGKINSVQQVKREVAAGARLEVFKVSHEFKEAWQK